MCAWLRPQWLHMEPERCGRPRVYYSAGYCRALEALGFSESHGTWLRRGSVGNVRRGRDWTPLTHLTGGAEPCRSAWGLFCDLGHCVTSLVSHQVAERNRLKRDGKRLYRGPCFLLWPLQLCDRFLFAQCSRSEWSEEDTELEPWKVWETPPLT